MAKWLFKIGLVLATVLILLILALVGEIIFNNNYQFPENLTFGVTFSPRYAKYLKLDWKQTFTNSLDQLKIRNFRIPTYWDDLEKKPDQFSFDDSDFMISEAEKRGAKAILVVGTRQPRWPECYTPNWAKNLTLEAKKARILLFIQKVVQRYKDSSAIWAYQVENEPFLPFFGEGCDRADGKFLKTEVDLVRTLSNKPIIVSDSGELGSWIVPMQTSDIFGTSLYRDVYNPVMGYFSYPILPYLYNLKSEVIRNIFAKNNQKTIIVEQQAEPWIGKADLVGNSQEQARLFPLEKLKNYLNFAKKTGFDTDYLWGVEWWYWMAKHGYPEYLEYAKGLFR